MAEIVEEMQERLLPEYEQMKRFEIFTDEQIREMIEKRFKYQSGITKGSKTVRDFLDFIIYERKVHRLITEKEQAHGSKLTGLKSSIVKRIIKLYREALGVFPYEETLWQNFIQFSKKSVPFEVAGIYEKFLTLHGDKPKYWSEAAIWCFQQTGKIAKPKSILYRALDRHPKADILHKTLFELLLKNALNMNSERNLKENTISEQEFGLEYVRIAYEHSKQHIKDIDYYLSLLKRCEMSDEMYSFTLEVQKTIIDDLMEHYSANPKLWNALAQRELNGFHFNDLKKCLANNDDGNESKNKSLKPRPLKERMELSYKVYKDAVNTLKNAEMFEYFVNAMLSLNEDTTTYPELKFEYLMNALSMVLEAELISDEHLNIYVNILLKSEQSTKEVESIFERLSKKRTSLKFYTNWLDCIPQIYENDVKSQQKCVLNLYRKSQQMLAVEDFVEIVHLVIEFYKNLQLDDDASKQNFLNQLFNDLCLRSVREFGVFRAECLESVYESTGSIRKTREKFKELSQLTPPSVELYQKMMEIESNQNPPDVKRWRLLLEEVTSLCGDVNSDIWLEFLRFERDHGSAKNMTLLYTRAKSRLRPELIDDFTTKYTLLNNF